MTKLYYGVNVLHRFTTWPSVQSRLQDYTKEQVWWFMLYLSLRVLEVTDQIRFFRSIFNSLGPMGASFVIVG